MASLPSNDTVEQDKMEKKSSRCNDSAYPSYAGQNEKDHTAIDIKDSDSESLPPIVDPYVPLPHDPRPEAAEDEDNILRIRAIFVGAMLGGVVNAANVYLGLKTGLTFVATLFGSLVGFAVLKSITSVVPESFPILGGKFGPKENTIVQTSATAAGGLSNIFVSADPVSDYSRIATVTLGIANVGFFFATPLRNFTQHPPWSRAGDRCSRNEIEVGVATQYTCLGLTAIVCGLFNILLSRRQVNRWGLKVALLINIAFPVLRSSVQAACVLFGGLPGIMLMHASQLLAVIGGTGGGVLVLNMIVAETAAPNTQTAAIGMLTGSNMFGSALGYQMGGVIGNRWGIQAPFFVSAGALVFTFIFVVSFIPSIPSDVIGKKDTLSSKKKLIKFPIMLRPQRRTLKDHTTIKYYGPILLVAGTFASFVGTGNVLALLMIHSGAVFHFSSSQNSSLMAINSLVRSVFLIFVFPRMMAYGLARFVPSKNSGRSVPGTGLELCQGEEKQHSVGFNLSVLRLSLVMDALLTGSIAFTTQSWQIFLVGALQPLASGIAPTSKGILIEICPPTERADAL